MFQKWGYRSLMIVLLALCLLHWLHGYWYSEGLGFNINQQSFATESFRGTIYMTYYATPPQAGGYWTYTIPATPHDHRPMAGVGTEFTGFCWAQGGSQSNAPCFAIGIPYWFIVLLTLLATIHVWRDTGREKKPASISSSAISSPGLPPQSYVSDPGTGE